MKPLNVTHLFSHAQAAIKYSSCAIVTGSFLAGTAMAAPPVNDDFASAIDLPGSPLAATPGIQTNTVDTTEATGQAGEGAMLGSVKTVWFKWTCPVGGGKFTVDTLGSKDTSSSEWGAVLAVSSGAAVNTQTRIGGTYLDRSNSTNPTTNSPANNGDDENISIAADGGITYYIQLAGDSNGGTTPEIASSSIKLTWSFLPTVYEAKIINFGPGAVVGAVSGNTATINNILPYGTDLATYAPTFTMSPSATCDQASGAVPSPNFSMGPVVYKVTASGISPTVNSYTVTATADGYVWNLSGGGDWDTSTTNWQKQPGGLVTTYSPGSSAVFNDTAGGNINIPLAVTPVTTLVSAPSGTYTFSGGNIAGAGSITKSNGGTLNLNGVNTYSGSTSIEGGTLVVNGNSAVGGSTSFSVATGATLQLNGTDATNYKWSAAPATLTGAGTVNLPLNGQAGVGTRWDMSTFTGNLNISGGMMGVNTTHSPGFSSPVNGTINVGNAATLYLGWDGFVLDTTVKLNSSTDNSEGLGVLRASNGTLNGALILGTNTTIGADGTLIINAVISDGGNGFGFTQVARGTVTLTATNTYTGPTIVNGGNTLKCDTSGSLGGGALNISGVVNLNFDGNRDITSLKLSGVSMAPGIYGSSTSPAPAGNQDNARFAGTGTVTVSPPVVVVGKTVLWNVAGGGDWDLSTSNWFTQPSGPVSTFVNNDVAIFNNPAGGTINIPSTVSPFSTTVNAASGNYTFSGAALGGTGSLTMNALGSLTLNSPNTYSGATVVNNGTLVVNGNSAVGGSTSFSVATGATLQLNGTNVRDYKWPLESGSLTGAGTVNLPLNGWANVGTKLNMSTFTGNLNISGGMMGVNTTHSPGLVSPVNGTINVGNATTLYLGWTGFVLDTTVKLNGSTDNGEGLGVLRSSVGTLNGKLILGTNTTIGADGTLTINAVISDGGNGFGFTQVARGTVTLTAVNTYTGNTTINAGNTLSLADNAQLKFVLGATSGVSNRISGGGTAALNGDFLIDTTAANALTSGTWTLENVPSLTGIYGSSFTVVGYTANIDNDTWTKTASGKTWTFVESTGVLTLTSGSDYSTWVAVYLPADVSNLAADNDGDGLTNQQEYAFGLNPTLGTSVSPITAQLDAVTGNFKYTRRATPAATGLTYTVFTSTNLVNWVASGATETGFTTAGDIQTVSVNVTAPAVDGKLFVRVEAKPAP